MKLINSKNISAIFVDCFDTIILRRCHPCDVLSLWYDEIQKVFSISSKDFELTWREAVNVVSLRHPDKEEQLFGEIVSEVYLRVKMTNGELPRYDNFLEFLENSMLQIEFCNSYLNDEMIEFLKDRRAKGLKIYCVSDFYMPTRIIKNLFNKLGVDYLFDDIYVSSDNGKRKSSGSLYSLLLKALNLNPAEVLMIGDNRLSDYIMPLKMGINACHYKIQKDKRPEHQLMRQLENLYYCNKKDKQPYANYVFSLFLFCHRLYKYVSDNKINQIYFFSREGEFLKRLFERYVEVTQSPTVSTKYLYISRLSSYLPSFKEIDKEDFARLRKQYRSLSLSQFVDDLGLLNDVVKSSLSKKYDLNTIIPNFFDSNEFHNFIESPEFKLIYERNREKKKVEFINYLDNIGITSDNSYCIVDIGWKGTIQDNLQSVINKPVCGLYFGLRGDVSQSKNNIKKGLMFSTYPYPDQGMQVYAVNSRIIERLLYASHGSCYAYKNGNPELEIMSGSEQSLYQFVLPIQNVIYKQFEYLSQLLSGSHTVDVLCEKMVEYMHTRYLLDISREKIVQQRFMDKKQKMSAGDSNNCLSQKEKIQLMYRLLRNNRVEFINKLILQMANNHLYYFAKILSCMYLYVSKKSI